MESVGQRPWRLPEARRLGHWAHKTNFPRTQPLGPRGQVGQGGGLCWGRAPREEGPTAS